MSTTIKQPDSIKKTWKEFRETGLLLFINEFLHIFGWAITVEFDKEHNIKEVYPARVSYRGFREESVDKAYTKITKYLAKNSKNLLKEIGESENDT